MPTSEPKTRPGEFELIAKYFSPLAGPGSFGLRDDAALISPSPGMQFAVTQDAVMSGVHFFAGDPPFTIAQKALRVNLSDLAAKGARPVAFSMALGLPENWTEEWLAKFAAGLAHDCAIFGLSLTGGDTFSCPAGIIVSITAWGEISPENYTSRLGAGANDELWLTGLAGEAAIGLEVARGNWPGSSESQRRRFLDRYLVPDPPVGFAPAVARFATASIDVSDGLLGDAAKLAAASGVDFEILLSDIPMPEITSGRKNIVEETGARAKSWLEIILNGGDDYQILFTAPQKHSSALQVAARQSNVRLSRLAIARQGNGSVTILDAHGSRLSLAKGAFSHF